MGTLTWESVPNSSRPSACVKPGKSFPTRHADNHAYEHPDSQVTFEKIQALGFGGEWDVLRS